jgi:uncharacterized surface protein with fasciclin (FAS1) repeats
MQAKFFAASAWALLVVFSAASHAADENDIVDLAAGSREHTILVTAVKEAGLVDMLKGKGPFTLFAPTDAAFTKLGEEKIKALVKDRELLRRILLAHVVPGKALYVKDVIALNGTEVNGFKVAASGKDVTVGGAKVTKADLKASNGVVHVIDAVMIPKQ